MHTITKDPMSYKSYCKNDDVVTIRLRIIAHRIRDGMSIQNVAYKYSMHRNSVRNIMNEYESRAPQELREKLHEGDHLSSDDIERLGSFLIPQSRRPKTHPMMTNEQEESLVKNEFAHL